MCENPSGLSPAERLAAVEREILFALAGEDGEQSIRTVDELGLEVESIGDARVAVRALHGAGVIHETSDGHYFASRPACYIVELLGHVS
jgi:hypothetical protein